MVVMIMESPNSQNNDSNNDYDFIFMIPLLIMFNCMLLPLRLRVFPPYSLYSFFLSLSLSLSPPIAALFLYPNTIIIVSSATVSCKILGTGEILGFSELHLAWERVSKQKRSRDFHSNLFIGNVYKRESLSEHYSVWTIDKIIDYCPNLF